MQQCTMFHALKISAQSVRTSSGMLNDTHLATANVEWENPYLNKIVVVRRPVFCDWATDESSDVSWIEGCKK